MNTIQGTNKMITEITHLLDLIDEQSFKKPLNIFDGSTLGQHFRHIFNFYDSILNTDRQKAIDYGARNRDVQLEQDPKLSKHVFEKVNKGINDLNENEAVKVKADFSANLKVKRPVLASTIGRELMFAYDHAVHHLAIIRIGLKNDFPDIVIDKTLGVAPSTIKYEQTKA